MTTSEAIEMLDEIIEEYERCSDNEDHVEALKVARKALVEKDETGE